MRASMTGLVRNILLSRTAWLRKLLDPRRDIDAECGHPEIIEVKDYARFYERGNIARRVVNIFPEESWNESPEILEDETDEETEFERAWKDLEDKYRIWHYLQRADMLSGVGRFGILLIGVDDGAELKEPLEPGEGRELLYLRPFEEHFVTISQLETDATSPRYGLPVLYAVQFADTALGDMHGGSTKEHKNAQQLTVHWSRVIHVVDNRQNSDVFGRPRMEVVFNNLFDLKKIVGGSGEMFWKGGFPGISLEAANPEEDVEFDNEATQEQMDRYMNGLQRYIALVGMHANSLAPQVADPRPHVEVQLKLIASAIGVPWRIFIGSEQAQLASEQDTIAWNKRIGRRRDDYVTPFIIKPLIERFMEIGVLPQTERFTVKWPPLNVPTEEARATVAEKKTNALGKYVQTGADVIMPPFHYLTLVLGYTDEEANGILEEAGDRVEELTPEFEDERNRQRAEEAAERQQRLQQSAPAPPQISA